MAFINKTLAFLTCLPILLSGCGGLQKGADTAAGSAAASGAQPESAYAPEPPTRPDAERTPFRLPALSALAEDEEYKDLADVNWFHLTLEQKLADFDSLYQTLQENSPFLPTIKRVTGHDLTAFYEEMRPLVAASESDAQFLILVQYFMNLSNTGPLNIGHLYLVNPGSVSYYADDYRMTAETLDPALYPDGIEFCKRIADAYADPKALEAEQRMAQYHTDFYRLYRSLTTVYEDPETDQNVSVEILRPGEIAYIKINGLEMRSYEQDKETLFSFYREIADYDHVIFDFTDNSGGGVPYFLDLIVAPNIEQPVSSTYYYLAKDGANNNRFYDFTTWKPVDQLPKLPQLKARDLEGIRWMSEETFKVKPLAPGNKMLNGKLWLLVSKKVFSSSELAASFAKDTGLFTLCGERTGGGGLSSDPLPYVLQNSGLVIRYTMELGLTPDGANNQEYGTMPDYVSPEGETALDTCLRMIEAG